MKPEEYDVQELKRLMLRARELDDDVHDVEPLDMTDDEREMLYDARYHAHKLARLLFQLARTADEAYRQQENADVLGMAAPPGWFGNR